MNVLVILTQSGGGESGRRVLWKTDTVTAEVGQSNYGLTFTDLRTPEHRRLRYIVRERKGERFPRKTDMTTVTNKHCQGNPDLLTPTTRAAVL